MTWRCGAGGGLKRFHEFSEFEVALFELCACPKMAFRTSFQRAQCSSFGDKCRLRRVLQLHSGRLAWSPFLVPERESYLFGSGTQAFSVVDLGSEDHRLGSMASSQCLEARIAR